MDLALLAVQAGSHPVGDVVGIVGHVALNSASLQVFFFSWVRIQLLPSTWQTLSVLRWVATWDDTVPCAGL